MADGWMKVLGYFVAPFVGLYLRCPRTAAFSLLVPLALDILRYQQNVRRVRHIPGIRQFLPPFSPWMRLLPRNYFLPYDHRFVRHVGRLMDEHRTDLLSLATSEGVVLYTRSAEHVREMTVTRPRDFPKPVRLYRILDFFGVNIVTAPDGPLWQKHRALCSPAFSSSNLDLVREVTQRHLDTLLAKWQAQAERTGQALVDAERDMTSLTLAVIAEAGFGQKFGVAKDAAGARDGAAAMSFEEASEVVSARIFLKLLLPGFAFHLPIRSLRYFKAAFDVFSDTLLDVIRSRDGGAGDAQAKGNKDLLSLLLRANRETAEARHRLSGSEIYGNTFMFLLAGHETLAGALTWALRLLARYPAQQETAHREIDRVLGSRARRDIGAAEVNELVFCAAIFKEALRMFPSVVVIPKYCPTGSALGGVPVPAGAIVNIDAKDLHRNAKYWADPDEFRPGRFLDEGGAQVVPFSWIPFSHGARSCIGNRFALIEGTLALVRVLQQYTVRLPPGAPADEQLFAGESVITLKPSVPVRLVFERRAPRDAPAP